MDIQTSSGFQSTVDSNEWSYNDHIMNAWSFMGQLLLKQQKLIVHSYIFQSLEQSVYTGEGVFSQRLLRISKMRIQRFRYWVKWSLRILLEDKQEIYLTERCIKCWCRWKCLEHIIYINIEQRLSEDDDDPSTAACSPLPSVYCPVMWIYHVLSSL